MLLLLYFAEPSRMEAAPLVVPGWVKLCGNAAPFAAIVVFLAVSSCRFIQESCEFGNSYLTVGILPFLYFQNIIAHSNYSTNCQRSIRGVVSTAALYFHVLKQFPMFSIWGVKE